jgi:hypothetical protein
MDNKKAWNQPIRLVGLPQPLFQISQSTPHERRINLFLEYYFESKNDSSGFTSQE